MPKQKYRLATTLLLSLISVSIAAYSPAILALASSPTFSCTAKPSKSAYYINETVQIDVDLTWKFIAQNYTVDIELWNSTASIATLDDDYVVDYTNGGANGTYSPSAYSVNYLTNETGTFTYTVKVIDTSSLITICSASINVVVQERTLYLSAAWVDQNQDRTIDVNEQVTFTVYTTYSFANESDSLSLYVNDEEERLIDTVSISAGSGQVSDTYITTFSTAGSYILKFWLEDSEGVEKKATNVQLTVGETTSTTTTTQASWADQFMQALYEWRYLVIAALAIAVVAVAIIKFR